MEKTRRIGSKQTQKNATLRIKKVLKREEAEKRQAKHDKLSLTEKLEKATGKKEIAKLKEKIAKVSNKVVTPSTDKVVTTSPKATTTVKAKSIKKSPLAKSTKTPTANSNLLASSKTPTAKAKSKKA